MSGGEGWGGHVIDAVPFPFVFTAEPMPWEPGWGDLPGGPMTWRVPALEGPPLRTARITTLAERLNWMDVVVAVAS